jgi:hypothetical protein
LKTLLGLFALSMVLFASPAQADQIDIGKKIGISAADIVKVLGDNGYEMDEFERDDDYIEVEARSDTVELEIKIDPDSGEIVKIEKEHRTAYEKKRGPGKKGRGKARRGDDDDRDDRSDRRRAERGDDDGDEDRDDND